MGTLFLYTHFYTYWGPLLILVLFCFKSNFAGIIFIVICVAWQYQLSKTSAIFSTTIILSFSWWFTSKCFYYLLMKIHCSFPEQIPHVSVCQPKSIPYISGLSELLQTVFWLQSIPSPQTFQHHKVPVDQPQRQIQEVETPWL